MADIDEVFEKSDFKGYEGVIPDPRPGTVRVFYSINPSKNLSLWILFINSNIYTWELLHCANHSKEWGRIKVETSISKSFCYLNIYILATHIYPYTK